METPLPANFEFIEMQQGPDNEAVVRLHQADLGDLRQQDTELRDSYIEYSSHPNSETLPIGPKQF
ncbi:MAG: hypothetical protein V1915_01770 [Candidatus Bathyarchaeota archaeon]